MFRFWNDLDQFAHTLGGNPSHLGVDIAQRIQQCAGVPFGKILHERGHRGPPHPGVGVTEEAFEFGGRR
jgi:hypothetical protein